MSSVVEAASKIRHARELIAHTCKSTRRRTWESHSTARVVDAASGTTFSDNRPGLIFDTIYTAATAERNAVISHRMWKPFTAQPSPCYPHSPGRRQSAPRSRAVHQSGRRVQPKHQHRVAMSDLWLQTVGLFSTTNPLTLRSAQLSHAGKPNRGPQSV